MDASTQKIVGIVLIVLGVVIALFGVYSVIGVYDHNASLGQVQGMAESFGGEQGGQMAQGMTSQAEAAYTPSVLILIAGVASAVGGVITHSKASRKEKSEG